MDENASIIAKVADFGLTRSIAPTSSGVLSSWQWHAPEVLDPFTKFYDEKMDVYSYG